MNNMKYHSKCPNKDYEKRVHATEYFSYIRDKACGRTKQLDIPEDWLWNQHVRFMMGDLTTIDASGFGYVPQNEYGYASRTFTEKEYTSNQNGFWADQFRWTVNRTDSYGKVSDNQEVVKSINSGLPNIAVVGDELYSFEYSGPEGSRERSMYWSFY
jgi:hypothetical protein